MKFNRFPFDVQVYNKHGCPDRDPVTGSDITKMIKVCNITMESFAYEKYDMLYEWHDPALEFVEGVKLDQFQLQGRTLTAQ